MSYMPCCIITLTLTVLCTTETDNRHFECKSQFKKIISAMFESSSGGSAACVNCLNLQFD